MRQRTVGATDEPVAAKAVVEAVNRQGRVIRGVVDRLRVVRFDGQAVELCEQIALA